MLSSCPVYITYWLLLSLVVAVVVCFTVGVIVGVGAIVGVGVIVGGIVVGGMLALLVLMCYCGYCYCYATLVNCHYTLGADVVCYCGCSSI